MYGILLAPGVVATTACGASISQMAVDLGGEAGMPLWDKTGLSGSYDFTFRYSQDASADFQADAPSLATALRENLGLTLQKQKGPFETLVVDYIEPPSDN